MNDKQDSIVNAIALRYSEKFAPPEGTIQAHIEVLQKNGYVWYGKIGKTIGDKAVRTLLSNETPRILLIDSGKTDRYWAKITEVKKEMPECKTFPKYYEQNLENFKIWFKIIDIQKAQSDVLAHCIVASSGAVLSIASKQSMSPFFMINVEEQYI